MDAANLATIFAPNILHKSKVREFVVESAERLDERDDVINVVRILIEQSDVIFQVGNSFTKVELCTDTRLAAASHSSSSRFVFRCGVPQLLPVLVDCRSCFYLKLVCEITAVKFVHFFGLQIKCDIP